MKRGFDEAKMEPRMALEEKDLADAFLVRQMMQHPGWKILEKYFEADREQYLHVEGKWVLDKEKHDMIQILVAKRSGYEHSFALASGIVKRADDFVERHKKKDDQMMFQTLGGE